MPWSKIDLMIVNSFGNDSYEFGRSILEELRSLLEKEKRNPSTPLFIKDLELRYHNSFVSMSIILGKKYSSYVVDIVCTGNSSDINVELMESYLNEYALLKPIFLLLKQVLYLSKLTDSFNVK